MDKSSAKLELHKILERVAGHAGSRAGRERVLALQPASNRAAAELLRRETAHAAELIASSIEPVVSGLESVFESVRLLRQGTIALEPSLLRGAGEAFLDMAQFRKKAAEVENDLPGVIHSYTHDIPDLFELGKKLIRITTPDGELSPNASPELKRLLGRIESLRSSLTSRLSAICARYAGTGILRDSPPTVRSGRFVLPVASTRKNSVKGLVHDRSESGATVFIEPSELVEAGNELQEAMIDMEQERRRILREITAMVREELDPIEQGVEILSELDLIFARGRYHREYETVFPEEGPVDLRGIVHPLLPADTAVRSNVALNEDWRVIVISGPNAGGKSVLLKAVALASLCSRAGLGAHVLPGSSIPFFSRIMVSMGDNQSIAMHLSTYSARLSEQIEILKLGDSETLAIVDEPAAGTDPVTGAALAAVFLESIADNGVRAIVSTHMGQLKLLAMEKRGFYNGSMSFNPETLTPGFEFINGIPGASCTLEAAAIAGFPERLLSRASELSGESFSLDSLVASLRELEEKRRIEVEELAVLRKKTGQTRRNLEKQLRQTRKKSADAIISAESEKAMLLQKIQSEADSLMVALANTASGEERRTARRKLSGLVKKAPGVISSIPPERTPGGSSGDLNEGDRVGISGWTDTGVIEKLGRSTAMVRVGSMLVKKDLADLERTEMKEEKDASSSEYSTVGESPEVMLLGMTVDEALVELDIKLDNCTAGGLKRLRIVHGKGRLMQGVTDWLRRDRRVRSVSIASPEEGGTGASIVFLKG